MEKNKLIEVIVMTFNHEKFIEQALNSVVSQHCDYDLQITIYDDCSTDNNVALIKKFMKNYSGNWNLIDSKVNQLTNGMNYFCDLLNRSVADYIALLDGDDFWTCDEKLQIQADALSYDDEAALCHHKVSVVKNDILIDELPPSPFRKFKLPGVELSSGNFIATPSVMFKRKDLPSNFGLGFNKLAMGDYPVWSLVTDQKSIIYLDKEMAVHRKHSNSYWSGNDVIEQELETLFAKSYLSCMVSAQSRNLWIEGIVSSALKINHERFVRNSSKDDVPYSQKYKIKNLIENIRRSLNKFLNMG